MDQDDRNPSFQNKRLSDHLSRGMIPSHGSVVYTVRPAVYQTRDILRPRVTGTFYFADGSLGQRPHTKDRYGN